MLPGATVLSTCRRRVKVTIPMVDATTTFGDGVALLEQSDGIAGVVLNRPGQHNALSKATWAGLVDRARLGVGIAEVPRGCAGVHGEADAALRRADALTRASVQLYVPAIP